MAASSFHTGREPDYYHQVPPQDRRPSRMIGPQPPKKTIVLCFDGTGNKFQGNDGDSNIIKIYKILEKQDHQNFAYYQPGIGTYVDKSALSKTSHFAKFRSWYQKAKDQALGTTFDVHVEGAYSFLMHHYSAGAHLYFFGFSRGAYIARFLAQMLDSVGLLNSGNEELFRFAWKAFAGWQTRLEETDEQKKKKWEMYDFMRAFRETFSRPVTRIRFLGLFDTVNSVPRFENAWMQRAKFPYAAKSSARVIRHAVAIDERRAKFRQDLVSQNVKKTKELQHKQQHRKHDDKEEERHKEHPSTNGQHKNSAAKKEGAEQEKEKERRPGQLGAQRRTFTINNHEFARFKPKHRQLSVYPDSRGASRSRAASPSARSGISANSMTVSREPPPSNTVADEDDDDETFEQDIEEVWFPGCHADIGGGWPLATNETVSLSHAPLVWMVREARTAGAPFDEDALDAAGYLFPDASHMYDATDPANSHPFNVPHIAVGDSSYPEGTTPDGIGANDRYARNDDNDDAGLLEHVHRRREHVHHHLHTASTAGVIHDALSFNAGTPHSGVLSWRFMEYMPFRRMDLKEDGTWAPIRFPLPMGEVRDIPKDAVVHNSVLRRMKASDHRGGASGGGGGGGGGGKDGEEKAMDKQPNGKKGKPQPYRPGNLIVGGGGRGVRFAPEHYGIGEWKVLREEGDPVGECWVRRDADVVCERDHMDQEKNKTTIEGAGENNRKSDKSHARNGISSEKDTVAGAGGGGGGGGGGDGVGAGVKFAGGGAGADSNKSGKWKESAKDKARKLSLWM
ncbi:MAG: hypothetical protein M1831_000510 [Alyxoria varia]|nr:MAG: hypothetical protein M1831_000510 [Alyxoria varia]